MTSLAKQQVSQCPQLECPSCHQLYTFENTPKLLKNCAHKICLRCLKKQKFCSLDSQPIGIQKYGLRAFLTDTETLQIIGTQQIKQKSMTKSARANASSVKADFKSKSKCISLEASLPSKADNKNQQNQQEVKNQKFVDDTKFFQNKKAEEKLDNTLSQRSLLLQQSLKTNGDSEICLLHSKPTDVICMDDRSMICTNCALFGAHKGHKIISYDDLLQKITQITDESFKVYQNVRQKSQAFSKKAIDKYIETQLRQRRTAQVKNIRTMFAKLIEKLRKVQKQAVSNLDNLVNKSIKRLQTSISTQDFQERKNIWINQVHKTGTIMQDINEKKSLSDALQYIDPKCEESFISQNGEYLCIEMSAFDQMVRNIVVEESNNLKCEYDEEMLEKVEKYCSFNEKFYDIVKEMQQSKRNLIQSMSSGKNNKGSTAWYLQNLSAKKKDQSSSGNANTKENMQIPGVEVIKQEETLASANKQSEDDDFLLEGGQECMESFRGSQDQNKLTEPVPEGWFKAKTSEEGQDSSHFCMANNNETSIEDEKYSISTKSNRFEAKKLSQRQNGEGFDNSLIPQVHVSNCLKQKQTNHPVMSVNNFLKKTRSELVNSRFTNAKVQQKIKPHSHQLQEIQIEKKSQKYSASNRKLKLSRSSRSNKSLKSNSRSSSINKFQPEDVSLNSCIDITNTSYMLDPSSISRISSNSNQPWKNEYGLGNSNRNQKKAIAPSAIKKKLQDVPEKYKAIWEDARFDRSQLIDLTGAQLGDSLITGLAAQYLSKSSKVKTLKAIRNKLTDQSIYDLFSSLRCSNLTSINLSQNLLTQRALQVIEHLDLGNLKTITLSLNKINARKVKEKIESFKQRGVNVSI